MSRHINQIETPIGLAVDQDMIRTYAEITDDRNRIHIDPEFAATTSMGGVIAHGTLSMNLIWQWMGRTLGKESLSGAKLDIRFLKPVRPGDRVEAGGKCTVDNPNRYVVWIRNQSGENVIEGSVELAE